MKNEIICPYFCIPSFYIPGGGEAKNSDFNAVNSKYKATSSNYYAETKPECLRRIM